MLIHTILFSTILCIIIISTYLFIVIRQNKQLTENNFALGHTKINLEFRLTDASKQIDSLSQDVKWYSNLNNLDLDQILNGSAIALSYTNDLEKSIRQFHEISEQKYLTCQALLPEMQRDSTTMFNLVDYLRKYSDVYSASELLDEWDRNQNERVLNEHFDSDIITN